MRTKSALQVPVLLTALRLALVGAVDVERGRRWRVEERRRGGGVRGVEAAPQGRIVWAERGGCGGADGSVEARAVEAEGGEAPLITN